MKTLPLSEVKAKLSRLIDDVNARDEEVVITRNGVPAAGTPRWWRDPRRAVHLRNRRHLRCGGAGRCAGCRGLGGRCRRSPARNRLTPVRAWRDRGRLSGRRARFASTRATHYCAAQHNRRHQRAPATPATWLIAPASGAAHPPGGLVATPRPPREVRPPRAAVVGLRGWGCHPGSLGVSGTQVRRGPCRRRCSVHGGSRRRRPSRI